MDAAEVARLIQEAIPDAKVDVQDLRHDGDHFAVRVESATFGGLSVADQHRAVFAAMQGRVGSIIQTFSLTTKTRQR